MTAPLQSQASVPFATSKEGFMTVSLSLQLRRSSRPSCGSGEKSLCHRLHWANTVSRREATRDTGLKERWLDNDIARRCQLKAKLSSKRTLKPSFRFVRQETFRCFRPIFKVDDNFSAFGTFDKLLDLARVDMNLRTRVQLSS